MARIGRPERLTALAVAVGIALASLLGTTPRALPAAPLAVGSTAKAQMALHSARPAATAKTALLVGDSQSAGAAGVPGNRTWTQTALRAAGYEVQFVGTGGIGFVAANRLGSPNYPTSLTRNIWALPTGAPALVVIEGGGNDARTGATDAQILHGADQSLKLLHQRYPSSRMLMIGTLSGASSPTGCRRAAVDRLLGNYASTHHIAFVGAGDWLARYGLLGSLADGVHLTQHGHEVLAGVLATRLGTLQLTQKDTAAPRPLTPAGARDIHDQGGSGDPRSGMGSATQLRARGMWTVTSAPPPGPESRTTLPPCRAAISATKASPSP